MMAIVENILFVSGEPVTLGEIAKTLDISRSAAKAHEQYDKLF